MTEPAPQLRPAARDWIAWYDELDSRERREIRDRIAVASPDDVRADPELRHFFLFHVDDLVADEHPGTRRLAELHHVVSTLRGSEEPERVEARRKAVQFMLAEYQNVVRQF
ncbi:MAG: hypothetical protein ACYDCK_09860 [Thermoplasmatota archaeon]